VEKVCSRILIIDKGKLITDFSINELKEKRSETSLEDIFLTITKGGE
jgi:ABC-type Na+ transport system ATPase subunit NatA